MIFAVAHDITALKQVEKALSESTKRERTIIENALNVICALDTEGRFASINPACARVLGYQPEELIGRPFTDFIPLEEVAESVSAAGVMSGDRLVDFENRYVHKNGTLVNLVWTAHWSDSEQLLFAMAYDLTERKQAEAALEKERLFLGAVLDKMTDGLVACDGDGALTLFNRAARKLHGLPAEPLAPKNKEPRTLLAGGQAIFDQQGNKIGAVVGMHDITERKRAEEELKSFAARLERSNTELQDFASVASHDLQEPLRKVQAFGDRLKTKCGDALNDEALDYLGRMQNAAGRMQTLINDLLTLSRVESKAQPFIPVNLRRVAREVLSDLESLIKTTNAVIEIGELATVEADPTQMRQLLQNLIGNALKFHRPDTAPTVKISGRVCRSSAAEKDEIVDESDKNAVYCLTVEDNGIGFDEKYADKIFKVFQRLHGRSEYEGTGIGLAVCRKIVERHGGRITTESKLGEGATFTVELPIKHETTI